jgi:4-alpha-glucanotransferase
MAFPRASGVLLHPTSLPGRYGIGDLGPECHAWIDFLQRAKQKLWQVLPLGPTGYGDSPYQSFSAFAGNPYLVSPDALFADGLLRREDLGDVPAFPAGRVDFGPVITYKLRVLDRAFERFQATRGPLRQEFEAFAREHAGWLDDYALFMSLKQSLGAVWSDWDEPLALRRPAALAAARARLARAIDAQRFQQFVFFRQWHAVREHARAAEVRIIGDIPIFVAYDSADVWARRELFMLDTHGRSTAVAGVPPDYFAPTGQLWGNPLYRWNAIAADGYAWWIERFRATLELFDIVRLDHFRGFETYWEIPATALTAETGRWVEGPGRALFDALHTALGDVPILAEDLGDITPEVIVLRDAFDFPGMKIAQFAFGSDASEPFLPHNFPHNCAAYTGSHDNDTTRGWYETAATPEEQDFARRYLRTSGRDIAWDLIALVFASVADSAVVPLQDVLDKGTEARMNLPGRIAGNWGWRFTTGELTGQHAARLAELATLYGR